MSQHLKEMAGKQGDETKRVIANTFSKNADILEDLYSLIERLTSELREAKSQIQQLDSKNAIIVIPSNTTKYRGRKGLT